MDIVLVLLRLIHIVSAVAWFGLGITLMLIEPAMKALGDKRFATEAALYNRTRIPMLISIVAVIGTLAGILLYITGSSDHFTSLGNIALGIGAAVGLGAAGHGGAVTGPMTTRYAKLLAETVKDNKPIPADKMTQLRELSAKVALHGRLSAIMTLVALVLMASARYLA